MVSTLFHTPWCRVSSCEHSTDLKEPSGLAPLQSSSQGGSLSAVIAMVTAIDFCPGYPSGHCHVLPFCSQEKNAASPREELAALRPAGRMGGWWLIPEGSPGAV